MAKGKRRAGKPRLPAGADMLSQLQQLQDQMKQTQAELAEELLTVTAGGEAITIVISGAQRVQSVQISPELIESSDPEMLGDILVAAFNDAIVQSQTLAAQRLDAVTGGLGLPGS